MSDTTHEDGAGGSLVLTDGTARRLANLRPPWRPGESGNPKGRPSNRKLFEEALGRAVVEHAEAIVEALVRRAIEGDARMVTALLDRLVPRITRHELDAAEAPTKIVLEFQKPKPEAIFAFCRFSMALVVAS